MRILLVEDEPDLGKAIKRILTQEAYVVDWVQSGDEGLAYLESDTDLYTLDSRGISRPSIGKQRFYCA